MPLIRPAVEKKYYCVDFYRNNITLNTSLPENFLIFTGACN